MTLHLPDPGLRIEDRVVLVALPPGYGQGSAPLPVDYLLSGYPGRPEDWFVSGHVTQVLDQLVANRLSGYAVLVAPDVNGGQFTDSETLDAVGGAQVETWLTRDVVSAVEARWPVLGDRGHRVLAGISSGGFAALNVGLRHQDEFGTLLALEPYGGDPGNVTGRLLGGSTDLLHANSPSYYLPGLPLHRLLHVFLDVGSEGDTARVQDLGRLLSARAEDGVLRVEQGQGHTWFEAAAGLPYALANAARWEGDPVLGQILPESAFPLTHRDRYSLLLTQDAGSAEQQRACRRLTGGARTRRLPPRASIRSRAAHRPPSPPYPTGAPPAPAAAPSPLPHPTRPVVAAQ